MSLRENKRLREALKRIANYTVRVTAGGDVAMARTAREALSPLDVVCRGKLRVADDCPPFEEVPS